MNPDLYLRIVVVSSVITGIVAFFNGRDKAKKKFASVLKHDIDPIQMQAAEDRVSKFLEENNIPVSSVILRVGQVLKVFEGPDDSTIVGQTHLSCIDDDGNITVRFQPGLTRQERTFAFAHECGRVINNNAATADQLDGKHTSQDEKMADYVAEALLMPFDEVYDYLLENGYLSASSRTRIKLLNALSERYCLDTTIVLRRIQDVYMLREPQHIPVEYQEEKLKTLFGLVLQLYYDQPMEKKWFIREIALYCLILVFPTVIYLLSVADGENAIIKNMIGPAITIFFSLFLTAHSDTTDYSKTFLGKSFSSKARLLVIQIILVCVAFRLLYIDVPSIDIYLPHLLNDNYFKLICRVLAFFVMINAIVRIILNIWKSHDADK